VYPWRTDVIPIEDNLTENQLENFGHAQRKSTSVLVWGNDRFVVNGATGIRGRPKQR